MIKPIGSNTATFGIHWIKMMGGAGWTKQRLANTNGNFFHLFNFGIWEVEIAPAGHKNFFRFTLPRKAGWAPTRVKIFVSRLRSLFTNFPFHAHQWTFRKHFGNVGLIEPNRFDFTGLVGNFRFRHGNFLVKGLADFEIGNFAENYRRFTFCQITNIFRSRNIAVTGREVTQKVTDSQKSQLWQSSFLIRIQSKNFFQWRGYFHIK